MKILFICHLGQIQEYAGYVTALKKVGAVESVFLAMGADECDLAKELGAISIISRSRLRIARDLNVKRGSYYAFVQFTLTSAIKLYKPKSLRSNLAAKV